MPEISPFFVGGILIGCEVLEVVGLIKNEDFLSDTDTSWTYTPNIETPGVKVAFSVRLFVWTKGDERATQGIPLRRGPLKIILNNNWADVAGNMVGRFYEIPADNLAMVNKAIKDYTEQVGNDHRSNND